MSDEPSPGNNVSPTPSVGSTGSIGGLAGVVGGAVVDVDVEPACDAAHLTFEIALQVRIVDEHDVRLLAHFPKRGEMMHRPSQAVVFQFASVRFIHPAPEALDRIGRRRFPVAKQLSEILIPDGAVASGEEDFEIEIVHVSRQ